jgi:predicted MPP superfamily phosphohydrolase
VICPQVGFLYWACWDRSWQAFFLSASALFIAPAIRRRLQGWLLRSKLWTAWPLKIVALSDLYSRNCYVRLDRLYQIVARRNAFGTGIIVILGDVKAGHRFTTRSVLLGCSVAMLGALTAPLKSYGILENHDWWQDTSARPHGHGPVTAWIEMEKTLSRFRRSLL